MLKCDWRKQCATLHVTNQVWFLPLSSHCPAETWVPEKVVLNYSQHPLSAPCECSGRGTERPKICAIGLNSAPLVRNLINTVLIHVRTSATLCTPNGHSVPKLQLHRAPCPRVSVSMHPHCIRLVGLIGQHSASICILVSERSVCGCCRRSGENELKECGLRRPHLLLLPVRTAPALSRSLSRGFVLLYCSVESVLPLHFCTHRQHAEQSRGRAKQVQSGSRCQCLGKQL
jgi:hypothetical protein